MKTENKQYKLKRWYPSLAISWRTGDRYEYDADRRVMTNISNVKNGLAIPKEMVIKEQELHPDFWELIEEKPKPLFVTEDGVECFVRDGIVWLVRNNNFDKIKIHSIHLNDYDFEHKVFFHESNADKYIEENKQKPLFITEDGVEVFLGHSYILIDKEFIKHKQTASNIVYTEYFKKFKHESNADEYIWRNRRVFSLEDMAKRFGTHSRNYNHFEQLALERSNQ